MNVLVILQEAAYGDERAYNGLRLASNLAECDDVDVRIFCFGDAVGCAMAGQQLANGYNHLDGMITSAARRGAIVGLCGSCMDARGITDEMVIADARRSSLDEVDPAQSEHGSGRGNVGESRRRVMCTASLSRPR